MITYGIAYTKKDTLLKNYLEADSDVPISNMVSLAIEYYVKTGEYLPLGKVSVIDEHPDKKRRCLYFQSDSFVEQYLKKMNEEKEIVIKKIIVEAITGGVEIADVTERITTADYVIAQKTLLSVEAERITPVAAYEAHTQRAGGEGGIAPKNATEAVYEANTGPFSGENAQKESSEEKKGDKIRITFADGFIKESFS